MIKESAITNLSSYNSSMKKSLLDKIFFMDKTDFEVLVDYGSADGSMIKFLHTLFPEIQYIGYDIDPKMVEKAQEGVSKDSHMQFTSNWKEVVAVCADRKCCITLSSVIHEVYAYGTRADVDSMWNRVFSNTFDYIAVRDMIPSVSIDKRSDINDVKKLMCKANASQLREFGQVWGSIEQNKNLQHFLLKYRYEDNWE